MPEAATSTPSLEEPSDLLVSVGNHKERNFFFQIHKERNFFFQIEMLYLITDIKSLKL